MKNENHFCCLCSHSYVYKGFNNRNNIPHFLFCGHSACEKCINIDLIKNKKKLICTICQEECKLSDEQLKQMEKNDISDVFPINFATFGYLVYNSMNQDNTDTERFYSTSSFLMQATKFKKNKTEVKLFKRSKEKCSECKTESAIHYCAQCVTLFCDSCFTKIHVFSIFQNHTKLNLDFQYMKTMKCPTHDKVFFSFCQDCSDYVCETCAACINFKCKNHYTVPMEDKITELKEKLPHISETYECIKKSRDNLKYELNKINLFSRKKHLSIKTTISQHFSKLYAIIQSAESDLQKEVLNKIYMVEHVNNNITELKKHENDINDLIKHIQSIETLTSDYQYDISSMLKKCDEIIELKCCFTSEDDKLLQPTVSVEEALYDHLSIEIKNFCKIFGTNRTIELISVSELSPEMKSRFLKKDELTSSHDSLVSLSSVLSNSTETATDKPNKGKCTTKILTRTAKFEKSVNEENNAMLMGAKPGAIEKVYVTYIKNPNHFYVQRLSVQSYLIEMMKEFERTLNVTELDQIDNFSDVADQIYLTFDNVNKQWYRIQVQTDINQDLVEVMFLDYGHYDIVEKKSITLVPPKYASVPCFALKCRLVCSPVAAEWSDDDIEIMNRIVNRCEYCIMKVKDVNESIMEVDIQTLPKSSLEVSISLTEVFIFLNRCILNKNSQVNRVENPLKVNAHYFKNDKNTDDLLKTDDEVTITNVICENIVYVRKVDSDDTLKNIDSKLAETYDITNNSDNMVYIPRQNL